MSCDGPLGRRLIGKSRLPLLLLLIVSAPPLAFYGWFERNSHWIVDHYALDPSFANALKHADAASYFYSGLRFLWIPQDAAEDIVVGLGSWNERAEQIVKRGRIDSTLEIMKDLNNNMVGITVARWLELADGDEERRHRSTLLVNLGRSGDLLLRREQVELPAEEKSRARETSDVGWAENWFAGRREEIRRGVERTLNDMAFGEPRRQSVSLPRRIPTAISFAPVP